MIINDVNESTNTCIYINKSHAHNNKSDWCCERINLDRFVLFSIYCTLRHFLTILTTSAGCGRAAVSSGCAYGIGTSTPVTRRIGPSKQPKASDSVTYNLIFCSFICFIMFNLRMGYVDHLVTVKGVGWTGVVFCTLI